MKNLVIKIVLVGAATGLILSPLAGCARKSASIEPPEQTAKVEDSVQAGSAAADKTPVASAGTTEGAGPLEPLDTPPPSREALSGETGTVAGSRTSLGVMPVYFDFDRYVIRPDQVEMLRTNALYMKNNPGVKTRIEGNCDDRGSYVYNLALGEFRAMGAKKYLVNLGVDDDRLTTLSYGEEKPFNPGQDETAWAQNRRDDFVIIQ